MALKMTPSEAAEVKQTSGTYIEAQYRAPIEQALKEKADLKHIELDFPAVRPAHVHFKLKRLLSEEDAKQVRVGKHETHGVCLIYMNGTGS